MNGAEADDALIAVLAGLFGVAPVLALAAAGVFARVGAALAVLPGLGERGIPMRVRLGVALAITWLLTPLISGFAAEAPRVPVALLLLLVAEAAAGLLIGVSFRLLVWALQVAGTVASQSISISHIFGNPVAGEAEPSLASFLSMGGIALMLAGGLHVDAVAALAGLYAILPFGLGLAGPAVADWSAARIAETFALGLGLATPFVLAGFAYNLTLGALSRAMPQLLVALVGAPLLVGIGLAALWLSLPDLFARWEEARAAVAVDPLGGPGPGASPGGSIGGAGVMR
ncbi:MAG: flagellar biosynthetic protein FliR [Pseudomonadota bacterium]